MGSKSTNEKSRWIPPPWVFIGAAAVLFPILAFSTFQNISREKENGFRLLTEKGAALIRAFEAGTRSGMMGMHWDGFQLQRLLSETAQQTDIVYLLVTETSGSILAHDNLSRIGEKHGTDLDLKWIARVEAIHHRVVETPDGEKVFEVFGRFAPSGPPMGRHRGRMMFDRLFDSLLEGKGLPGIGGLVIFVGLDMSSVEEAMRADIRHAVVMGAVLLLIGSAGIILLFLAQNYHAAKTSLSRIKAFSDNVVENMPIGLLATDAAGKIASLNHAGASLLFLPRDDSIGRDAREIIPSELAELIPVPDAVESLEKEVECTLANKDRIPLEVIASAIADGEEGFQGSLLIFKDLTEVRALKKEITRSQRMASVGRLAAGVAHEIRNPLSSIKGFATYFKERYREKPEDQQVSGIMIQEVDRLNKVVGQLLDFARPVAIRKKRLPLLPFIADSVKLVERQAKEKGIEVEIRIEEKIEAFFDPDRLSQMLLNLYLNALEAMDSRGNLLITASRDSVSRAVSIQIQDTGIGIPKDNLGQIFDPYFTTKATGTGLGLAIVYNILEAHGGEIQVESQTGRGTRVTLLLPDADKEK